MGGRADGGGRGGHGDVPMGQGDIMDPHVPPVTPNAPQVTPEQAKHCGALEATMGQTLLLEARSPPLPPQRLRVGLGGPRGVLLLQTDKPLYAPRQTGETPPPPPRTPNPPR